MVLLKNIQRIILSAGFILLCFSLSAQSNETIISAFEKSYQQEKSGEYKKAAETLKKVYSDDSYELNLRIGWLLYNAGLFDESGAHYQKAVNLKPYAVEAKFGLVYPKAAQGKWKEVENIYKKILKTAPKNTVAAYRLGLIYYGRKEYAKAMEYFESVLNLYPFDYDALLMCGWTSFFTGKKRDAEVYFNKALMNNPSSKSAADGLSRIE